MLRACIRFCLAAALVGAAALALATAALAIEPITWIDWTGPLPDPTLSFQEPRPAPPPTPTPTPSPPPYNGCTAVPDYIRGVFDFTGPCNNHDICYSSGVDRATCDANFLRDAQAYCRNTYGSAATQVGGCLSVAGIYYEGLRIGARPWYQGGANAPVVPGSEVRLLFDSSGNLRGFLEFRPDGTQVMHTAGGTFVLNNDGTATILDSSGRAIGTLRDFTLSLDAAGNIIGIQGVDANGTPRQFTTTPLSGTVIYGRDNSTGVAQTLIYDANGHLTFVIDSRYGVINPNDGWGGFNPFSAAIQNPMALLGIGYGGGGGGWGGGGGGCSLDGCIWMLLE